MAGNHKVEIIVGVKDLATRQLQKIKNNIGNIGSGFSKAGSHIGAFTRNLDGAISKMDRLANSMYKFNMYTSSIQRGINTTAAVGGLAAGALATQGMNNALQYDYKTRTMQSRMEVSNPVRQDISKYILDELNNKVAYNPNQLADMGVVLGQAGISNAPDMKSMLKTVSYFSEAVNAVPEQAAEMVVAASKGFGISMQNSSEITDKLTVAMNKSLLHVEEMPHAIGELAGRANMFGQSFDSSLVALMTMRDQGMSAAQGSQDLLHGLRQASRIGNDQVLFEKTQGYFDSLGISEGIFNKDTRKLKEFPDLIADIEKAMINQGFTNPKYQIKNKGDYDKFLASNNGKAPQDFWDSMKAMPLITRVFGAAGQAPILMGMQSQYEEVNKDTGEKTGKVLYGSDALKALYNEVKNSNGAVERTHDIIAESGAFQVEVLKGAWESAQIKLMDNFVPIIKAGAEGLTSFLTGKQPKEPKDINTMKQEQAFGIEPEKQKTSLQKFEDAVNETADNFRKKGNPGMGNFVEKSGNMIVGGAHISKTMPALGSQFGDAFKDNFVNGDWGSGPISFPVSLVENSIGFIKDILESNEKFNELVNQLPENLQDPAKMIETITKGAAVLSLSGVIVKIVELAVRTASTALKGTKMAVDLGDTIYKTITGKGKKGKGGLGDILGKNMNINANVVNVNGKIVNSNGGGDGDIDSPLGPRKNKYGGKGKGPKIPPAAATGTAGILAGAATYMGLSAWGWSKWDGSYNGQDSKMLTGKDNMSNQEQVSKRMDTIKEQNTFTQSQIQGLKTYVQKIEGSKSTTKESKSSGGPSPDHYTAKMSSIFNTGVNGITGAVSTGASNIANAASAGVSGVASASQSGAGVIANASSSGIGQVATAASSGATVIAGATSGVNGSIVSGFNAANERLQNIKLQNNLNISVPAPSVNISGNIKQYLNVQTKNAALQTKYGDDWSRISRTMAKRLDQ